MKRCPACRRDYFDDSLLYCLDDGSALLDGPVGIHSAAASSEESATIQLHLSQPPSSFEPPTQAHNGNAIAVLPFANMSRDEDAEYLSDGLAEELLNVLSRINGLRVAGRTSSFSFKGKQTTFAEIGQQLRVSSVLEGSVRTAGKRVRISVQLVNVSDGYHLWSQTYDRTMDDIFAIQDDIAASVVAEVRSRLLDKEPDPSLSRQVKVEIAEAVKDRADDPEAHRLMLLGRHFAARSTAEDLTKAVDYLERALELDPQNPQCWVELGLARVAQASYGFVEPARGFEQVKECANTALSIRSDFAAAHALLAHMRLVVEFDLKGADEAIHRALESEPENLHAIIACGLISRDLCRFAESEEMYRRVVEIDPLDLRAYRGLGGSLWFSGRPDAAERGFRKALELSPQQSSVPAFLSLVLLDLGRIEEARAQAGNEPAGSWRGWAQAIIENAAGRRDEAERILDEFIRENREIGAFQIAEVYASMGRTDEAFEYLEFAFTVRDSGIASIVASPLLKPLHSDARWQPLIRKIGIPEEYWPKSSNSPPG
jgi:TolB-like protein/tetratricopeptide (TPR) repeat protein